MNTNSPIQLRPISRGKFRHSTVRILCVALAVLAALFNARVATAANIVWVSDYNDPATGFFPAGVRHTDSGFVTLLQNAGHNVIRYNPPAAQTTLMPQAEVDALNTNDLIIIGRAANSGAFRALQGNQWNTAVTKPLICMSPYLVRTIADNRMGWFTGDVGPDDTTTLVTAADPANPAVDFLLGGVAMLGNTTVSLFNEVLDRNTSHMLNAPTAGGRSLLTATFVREDNGATATGHVIAEFPAGTVVSLSNAPLAAYRMYMDGGSREGVAYPQSIPFYTGRENLTPAGENIFLRAVQLAINSGAPPASNPADPIVFTGQPADVTVARGGSATFSVSVSGAAPRTIEWQRDTGDGMTFAAIPDASTTFSASSITLTNLDVMDSGAKVRVVASNPNGTVISDVATLTVTADNSPPVPLAAGTIDGSSIRVCFDELLNDAPANNPATDPFSYILTDSGGVGVNAVTLGPDGRSVTLGLDGVVSPNYTLSITAVDDRFGNGIPEPGIILAGSHFGLTSVDVGTPSPAGTSSTCGGGSFTLGGGATSGGNGTTANDIQSLTEHFRFAYKSVTGDFDARVRVTSLVGDNRLEAVAKAILSARATTDGNAASVNVFVTPPYPGDETFGATARTTAGAATSSNFVAVPYGLASVPASIPNAWLRLTRAGDLFTTFGSANGTDWTPIGNITVPAIGPDALVGAGAASHRNGRLVFATFSNFSISQTPASPTLTGLTYAAGSFTASFQTQNGVTYTVQYKDDLNAASWTTLTTITGDGAVQSFTDPGPAQPQHFYNVIIP